jgi:hypothetical protein
MLAGAAIGTLTAGIFDALHFGTGREGQGICIPPQVHASVDGGPRSGVLASLEIQF